MKKHLIKKEEVLRAKKEERVLRSRVLNGYAAVNNEDSGNELVTLIEPKGVREFVTSPEFFTKYSLRDLGNLNTALEAYASDLEDAAADIAEARLLRKT